MKRLTLALKDNRGFLLILTIAIIASLALSMAPIQVPLFRDVFRIGMDGVAYGVTLDAVCDGINDDVQVQAILSDNVPLTGGEIILLAGAYDFQTTVFRHIDNVKISGSGAATIITTDDADEAPFNCEADTGWTFEAFACDDAPLYTQSSGVTTDTVLNGIWIGGVYTVDLPPPETIARSATLVVAADDATDAEKAQADLIGDGVDDTVVITAAYTELASTGGTIQLSTGTFVIPAAGHIHLLSGWDDITLRGQGDTTIIQKATTPSELSVFYKTGGVVINNLAFENFRVDCNNPSGGEYFNVWSLNATGTSTTEEVVGLVFDRITVDGGSNQITQMYLRHVSRVKATRSVFNYVHFKVDGQWNDGAELSLDDTTIVSDDILIEGCSFIGGWASSFSVGNVFKNFRIVNNHFDGGWSPIDTCISTKGVIANNTITGFTQVGIYVEAPRFVEIAGNTIDGEGTGGYGIINQHNVDPDGTGPKLDNVFVTIKDNIIKNVTENGVWLRGVKYTEVSGNLLWRVCKSGINAQAVTFSHEGTPGTYYCSDLIIKNNKIFHWGYTGTYARGIFLSEANNCQVIGNTLDANNEADAQYCIRLDGTLGCSDTIIQGNTMKNCNAAYYIAAAASLRTIITNNWWDSCTATGTNNGTGTISHCNILHGGLWET